MATWQGETMDVKVFKSLGVMFGKLYNFGSIKNNDEFIERISIDI